MSASDSFSFRFFDVVKPFRIRKLERFPGGWGIMADDVLAGIYSAAHPPPLSPFFKMKIEIIAVGSELLTPFFQDTNSLYLTRAPQ